MPRIVTLPRFAEEEPFHPAGTRAISLSSKQYIAKSSIGGSLCSTLATEPQGEQDW